MSFAEHATAYLSEQTVAAAEVVATLQMGDDWTPLEHVEQICSHYHARLEPVLALTSGRLRKAILRGGRIAQQDVYVSIHGKSLCALADDMETMAALAIYRTLVPTGERTVCPVGMELDVGE